ncbi:MAG: hypothetical protein QOJ72_2944, partial [Nocardioidaceae bacterium]|nr:hypothetical protein [Nocardioidaceae bacterium]
HAPPPTFFYYQVWFFAFAGVMLLVGAPVERDWRFLAIGSASLVVGILGMAFCAWMRERYNRWHPENHGLVDHKGHPVPRSQWWSDTLGASVIRLVTFRSHS